MASNQSHLLYPLLLILTQNFLEKENLEMNYLE
jgi:hypothetical protein